EIAETLSSFPGVIEANVYGVEVANTDGRAGMAALVLEQEIDMTALYQYLSHELATYAIPVFLRIQQEIEITGTFKHRKVDLVKAGFNLSEIEEPLYFADHVIGAFVILDDDLYTRIEQGEIRV
ncbi:MAG: long-chain-acyl-CoA synthetase, partial [Pseudomonadota bacterium]